MKETQKQLGTLYIVGTPIGNLEDMTFRAVRVLQTVDLIAAEDTRHTGKLLQHFQVNTPQTSYHHHNRLSRHQELIERLKQGETIALVTDAGMPAISDPGYDLVKACLDEQISVMPIPGVTALVTALAVAGLPTDRFVFEGFLPHKQTERCHRLNSLKNESRTLIFYEAPHRLPQTLQDLAEVFSPERKIVLARELTKLHEQFWRGTLGQSLDLYTKVPPKGEFTLVVEGLPLQENIIVSEEQLKAELQQMIKQGMTRSQASRQLSLNTAIARRHLYQLALELED